MKIQAGYLWLILCVIYNFISIIFGGLILFSVAVGFLISLLILTHLSCSKKRFVVLCCIYSLPLLVCALLGVLFEVIVISKLSAFMTAQWLVAVLFTIPSFNMTCSQQHRAQSRPLYSAFLYILAATSFIGLCCYVLNNIYQCVGIH